jgi:adenylate cyclase
MARWGAPAADPDHAFRPCRAALACEAALRDARLVDDHGHPLRKRIGINSGPALVGNIGSDSRLNYTAIGDTVNIASRIEGANKPAGTRTLVSEATLDLVRGRIEVGRETELALKGKSGTFKLFEVLAVTDGG